MTDTCSFSAQHYFIGSSCDISGQPPAFKTFVNYTKQEQFGNNDQLLSAKYFDACGQQNPLLLLFLLSKEMRE